MASFEASSEPSFKTADEAETTERLDPDEAKAEFTLDDEPTTPTEVVDIAANAEPSSNTGEVDSAAEQEQDRNEAANHPGVSDEQPPPTLPTLPALTPLPPLPSMPSTDGSVSDMLSTVATIGSDPPAASSTSSTDPQVPSPAAAQNMTEAEVDTAIQAEMAELKAEIAVLRSSIGDNKADDGKEKEGAAEDDVLRMAEFKLDYVEKSMRRL